MVHQTSEKQMEVFGSRFGVTDSGTGGLSMGGTRGVRLPQDPKFNGTNTKLPSRVKHFTLHVKHCDLLDTFTSTLDIQIDEIGIDLSPSMLAREYTVSQLKRSQVAWWYL